MPRSGHGRGCTGRLGPLSPYRIYIYDEDGTGLGNFGMASQVRSRQLAISGDGLRMVANSSNNIT